MGKDAAEKNGKAAVKAETHAKEPKAGKAAKGEKKADRATERDFSYTQNREISWLRFDDRILDEAYDESVPVFERLKFCEIVESNLDEWFMIRVGGLSDLASLKNQPKDNKSNMTPEEQLDAVFEALPPLIERHEKGLEQVEAALAEHGLVRVSPADFTEADRAAVQRHFDRRLAPIISPLIVDPRHPFPNLRNGRLFVACSLDGVEETGLLGMIEVPAAEARVVALPASAKAYRYTLLEDVLETCLDQCFGDYVPKRSVVLRVTRNADIDPDGEGVEEEEDYRQHMKKVLKLRQRLQPIRLEIRGKLGKKLEDLIAAELSLEPRRIFRLNRPIDLGYVYGLESSIPDHEHTACVYRPFEPQISPMVDLSLPMRGQVEDHDVLLTYPYESMTPLLRLVREASSDDACISIKITLYRVAKSSHLCESLISAAEAGKDVTVLMELRARFDEANNIAWAERLEDAGCTVIYGSEGFKCHSKICQITYHDREGISRITCLGTGNFNEKTAALYSDFMLLTADEGIGADGNTFFRNLSLGNLRGSYKHLGVAPVGLKPLVMRGLDREISRAREGAPAKVFLKMNSLTDRDVIDKISEACEAGVRVVMIVRGICCIKAGVPGKTDGLVVRQIAGRFLEHARIYAFGEYMDTIYLSSADMMTRNTERRVEIAYPVRDPACSEIVRHFVELQLSDNVKARQLTAEGTWARVDADEDAPRVVCQEELLREAYAHARAAAEERAAAQKAERIQPEASAGPDLASVEQEPAEAAEAPEVNVPPAPAAEPAVVAPTTKPARRGRLSRSLSLFGQAFGALFGGGDE
ncbi:polyphosphate kinase 1 [Olsenella sp. DSM 107455]|uniref:Polyphosphate kinase n=1 Tax=Thermophilibacter gallinarum TaxID=2779357 RepID=A0ABR9QUK2_9ACTN|nr:polyphosphate kinase 1 [Thermophilibacter gallinarum]MBE5024753.1 polyphosphate kinase 1 [Thermophilibacter gallinarum]